ncbi:hypothetical protein NC651_011276 [Populus alba x Populus x berolinensis]|nr:hypothetical protein NC651_011276 [Populus alba x Populus x berolinensis]
MENHQQSQFIKPFMPKMASWICLLD